MRVRKSRGFTLIELLVVIAIIGILATLLLTAISSAKKRTHIAVAKSEISAIKAALSNYKSDMGRFPRLAIRPTATNDAMYMDDCHALYAALKNRSTQESGGGQNAPYLEDWKPERIGWLNGNTYLNTGNMGQLVSDQNLITPLPKADIEQLNVLNFQKNSTHGPGSGQPLVLLDPWGNPYHYREWASVRASIKDAAMMAPTTRNIPTPPADYDAGNVVPSARDLPHSPESFDIWSNGPNGINEFGDPNSDDITSWSQG